MPKAKIRSSKMFLGNCGVKSICFGVEISSIEDLDAAAIKGIPMPTAKMNKMTKMISHCPVAAIQGIPMPKAKVSKMTAKMSKMTFHCPVAASATSRTMIATAAAHIIATARSISC